MLSVWDSKSKVCVLIYGQKEPVENENILSPNISCYVRYFPSCYGDEKMAETMKDFANILQKS
jgi:hypothetical protein